MTVQETVKQKNEFADYVYSFYGKGGIYENFFKTEITKEHITGAMIKYITHNPDCWGGGDSLDRERVRDIMFIDLEGAEKSTVEHYLLKGI
jgi:hypothetical protein